LKLLNESVLTSMLRLIWSIFFFLALGLIVHGQEGPDECDYVPPKQGDYWFFYKDIGLIFSNGTVQLNNLSGDKLITGKGSSVISDINGSLLFFTDGETVWNRNLGTLQNGTDLAGSSFSTQSSIIVPQPGDGGLYYIFSVDQIWNFQESTKGFRYSIVDMAGNSGLGRVTQKNRPLIDTVPEKVTSTLHANGIDYWVVTVEWRTNKFYAYLINNQGLDTANIVTSNEGTVQTGGLADNNSVGYLKFSADGSRLAQAIYGDGIIEIFDFNNQTGDINFSKRLSNALEYENAFGIEFSPNGEYLYYTSAPVNPFANKDLYQYEISSATLTHLNADASKRDVTALQLASDGKIYVARYESDTIGIIENPNRPGLACNYDNDGLAIVNESVAGMPNFVQSFFDIPVFTYIHHCYGDSTIFKITNTANIDSVFWNFHDAGLNNTSKDLSPGHIFVQPGDYNVSLTEYWDNGSYQEEEVVRIYNLPNVQLAGGLDTIFMYPGSKFTLDAGEGYTFYFWNGSEVSTGRYYEAVDTGLYSVTVVDTNCCWNTDYVMILPSQIYVPNAFTPNSDGTNDHFNAIGLVDGILNYQLLIFNRWGQLVFEGNSIQTDAGWDGNDSKGAPAPYGTYIYKIAYDIELDFGLFDNVVTTGYVTLLR